MPTPLTPEEAQQQLLNESAASQAMTPEKQAKLDAMTAGNVYNNALGTTPAPAAPAAPSALDTASTDYQNILQADMAPVNQADIQRKTMEQFQAEIDALNQLYATKKAEEAIQGEGRLGQSSAIQARRGLLGSDFGAAQTQTTTAYNERVQSALDAEKAQQISSIMSKARSAANEEFAAKTAARKSSAQDYIAFLSGSAARKKEQVTSLVTDMIDSGLETPEDFSALAEQLGTTAQAVKAEYNRQKAVKEAAKPKALATQVVAPGSSVYDPNTGKFIGTAPEKAAAPEKPFSVSPGSSVFDPVTGKILYTAPEAPGSNKPITMKSADGTDLQWNPSTQVWDKLSVPQASKAITPEMAQAAMDTVTKIDSILKSKGFSGAVGAGSLLGLNPGWWKNLPGTERQATVSAINALISSETLKNMEKIKGVLSDSDMKLLKEASTGGLNADLKETVFRDRINALRNATVSIANAPRLAVNEVVDNGDGTYSYKNNDGTVHTGAKGDKYTDITQGGAEEQYTPEELEYMKSKETTFNQPLSMGGNGSIKLGSNLARKNNNPGNLRFVGQAGATQGEGGFARFSTPEAGVQALKNQIALDASRGYTLEKFINKYAPPSENDTGLYVKQMAAALGASPNDRVSDLDLDQLTKAMARKESSSIIA